MNRHFEDARYHLGRTGHHLFVGVREEVEPYEERVREYLGVEEERTEGRVERVAEYAERARSDARKYAADARDVVTGRAE